MVKVRCPKCQSTNFYTSDKNDGKQKCIKCGTIDLFFEIHELKIQAIRERERKFQEREQKALSEVEDFEQNIKESKPKE
jgi:hypothetical protein